MFVNLMRSNQRWLMIVISTLVIISFIIFYGNRTQYDRLGSDKAGRIYGRNVSGTEFDRTVRQIQTAEELGLVNVTEPELTGSRDLNEVVANHLVMQHQADELGILPSNDEVKNAWENSRSSREQAVSSTRRCTRSSSPKSSIRAGSPSRSWRTWCARTCNSGGCAS